MAESRLDHLWQRLSRVAALRLLLGLADQREIRVGEQLAG
jgi:hypothetical protein